MLDAIRELFKNISQITQKFYTCTLNFSQLGFVVETKIPCNILECQRFVNNSYEKADVVNNVEVDGEIQARTVKIRFLYGRLQKSQITGVSTTNGRSVKD